MKLWHGLIGCLAVAGTAYVVHERSAQHAELEKMRADLGSLTHAVGEARQNAAPREDRHVRREVVVVPASAASVALEANPGVEPEGGSTAKAAPIEPAEVRVRYESSFVSEPTDRAWATTSQKVATAKLAAVLPPNSHLGSVECHSSMCRIESTHENIDEYQQFVKGAFLDPAAIPWNGAYFVTVKEQPGTGEVVTVAYLAREGQELPQLQ